MKIPEDNPQTADKIALGHQLFFDARLSVDGSRSCYSCHQNEHGNGGETPLAVGAKEKQLTRHSPVIWNTAYFGAFYWDGRAGSLEAQAKGAVDDGAVVPEIISENIRQCVFVTRGQVRETGVDLGDKVLCECGVSGSG